MTFIYDAPHEVPYWLVMHPDALDPTQRVEFVRAMQASGAKFKPSYAHHLAAQLAAARERTQLPLATGQYCEVSPSTALSLFFACCQAAAPHLHGENKNSLVSPFGAYAMSTMAEVEHSMEQIALAQDGIFYSYMYQTKYESGFFWTWGKTDGPYKKVAKKLIVIDKENGLRGETPDGTLINYLTFINNLVNP